MQFVLNVGVVGNGTWEMGSDRLLIDEETEVDLSESMGQSEAATLNFHDALIHYLRDATEKIILILIFNKISFTSRH